VKDPPLTPDEKLRDVLAALDLATQRFAESFDVLAAVLSRYLLNGTRWTRSS
jgi:hypothetical protein